MGADMSAARRLHGAALSVLLPCLLAPLTAGALEIVIEEGIRDALPIAVVPFYRPGAEAGIETPGTPDPAQVISNDLRYSGSFSPLPPEDLPGRPTEPQDVQFSDWQRIGAENLVIGRVVPTADGNYQVEFRLFDVYKREQIAGMRLITSAGQLRSAAHRISDSIYQKLTGVRGIFSTRIIYVSKQTDQNDRNRYLLTLSDYDGQRPQVLLESPDPILSPAWSADGERLAYVSFEGSDTTVYVQELRSGQRTKVSALPGLNGAPHFSPQGERLALALSKDGNSEIYVLHLASGLLQRITDHPAVDTEPAWLPDGEHLLFTSDRSGKPQIYEVQLQSGATRRLTFQGNYNAGADVSPDGELLGIVHGREGGGFRIATQDLKSSELTVITDGRLAESPSFSPNGKMIIHAASNGELSIVSISGTPPLRIRNQGENLREPAWAPFRTTASQ